MPPASMASAMYAARMNAADFAQTAVAGAAAVGTAAQARFGRDNGEGAMTMGRGQWFQ